MNTKKEAFQNIALPFLNVWQYISSFSIKVIEKKLSDSQQILQIKINSLYFMILRDPFQTTLNNTNPHILCSVVSSYQLRYFFIRNFHEIYITLRNTYGILIWLNSFQAQHLEAASIDTPFDRNSIRFQFSIFIQYTWTKFYFVKLYAVTQYAEFQK